MGSGTRRARLQSLNRESRMLAMLMLVLFFAALGLFGELPPFVAAAFAAWPAFYLVRLFR